MVRRPVQDALEAYAAERFGLTEAYLTFDMEDQCGPGDDRPDWVFVITINGETDGGEYTSVEFGSDEAVDFMNAAMHWERL